MNGRRRARGAGRQFPGDDLRARETLRTWPFQYTWEKAGDRGGLEAEGDGLVHCDRHRLPRTQGRRIAPATHGGEGRLVQDGVTAGVLDLGGTHASGLVNDEDELDRAPPAEAQGGRRICRSNALLENRRAVAGSCVRRLLGWSRLGFGFRGLLDRKSVV